MASKVIFIGDPYRGEQAVNIEKIRSLFSSVLRQLGVVNQLCITDINRSLDRDSWIPVWQESLKNYPSPFVASIDISDSAVIGFEVPDAELSYLSEKNVPWINLCIHPLRFLDDLYFDVKTSFAYDTQKMSVPLGLIDFCANRFANYQANQDIPSSLRRLLVCGQDWIDRSIYFDGQFRGLDYYIPQLDSLVRRFDQVLYKPHPSWESADMAELMRERYQAQNCRGANVYELFASGTIHAATAISSSVLTEAPYFGVESVFLEPRAKLYGPAISYRALLDNLNFWEVGLLRRKSSKKSLRISQGVPPNHLRRVFSSWGFVTEESRLEGRISALEKHFGIAEALIQSCEQGAAASEALAQEVEQRAAATEVLLKEQQKRIDELANKSHYCWQQVCALEAERNALRQSASWRITAPLRFAAGLVTQPLRTLRSGANVVIHRAICITERPLSRLMAAVLRRPQLSHCLNSWLLRYPALYQQLLGVARRGGVVPGAPVYSPPAGQVDMHASPDLASLTPRARQIYADLQAAIKNNKRTS